MVKGGVDNGEEGWEGIDGERITLKRIDQVELRASGRDAGMMQCLKEFIL